MEDDSPQEGLLQAQEEDEELGLVMQAIRKKDFSAVPQEWRAVSGQLELNAGTIVFRSHRAASRGVRYRVACPKQWREKAFLAAHHL